MTKEIDDGKVEIRPGLRLNGALVEILKEMCRRVGATLDKVKIERLDEPRPNGAKFQWPVAQFNWSMDEEEKFKKWVVDYLYNNTAARKALTRCDKNKKRLRMAVDWLIFDYGWSYRKP